MQQPRPALAQHVVDALRHGNGAEVMRLLGETVQAKLGVVAPPAPTPSAWNTPQAQHAAQAAKSAKSATTVEELARQRGLSPGEVPRTNLGFWTIVALLGGLAVWLLLRSPG